MVSKLLTSKIEDYDSRRKIRHEREIDKNLKCKNCWKNKERYCRNGIILQN